MLIEFENGMFVAKRDGEIVASSKNRDYLKRKIQDLAIMLPAARKPVEEFAINDRFKFVDELVRMVARAETPSVVLTGSGGLGKSYTVMKALQKEGMVDVSDAEIGSSVTGQSMFRVIKGYSTPKGLYQLIYDNRNSIIVFDDCDSILTDPTATNILKGALDSYDTRRVTWNSSVEDGLPKSFEFTGGIVFISNMDQDKIPQAIRSRSMNVDLSMTNDQKIERMEVIMQSDSFLPGVPLQYKQDALDCIKENVDKANDVSLRTLIMVTKIRASQTKDWRSLAKYMLVN